MPIRDIRHLDQSQIGRVLTGDAEALRGGPPVTAMLIQNTNPANVAPSSGWSSRACAATICSLAVHEHFMTDTAKLADVVLPATMFLEHDDIYQGGGHQFIVLGPKLVDPPEGPRTNLFVIEELAKRLGVADMPGFGLDERAAYRPHAGAPRPRHFRNAARKAAGPSIQPDFETAHYLDGFGHPDGKFRFRPHWEGGVAPNKPPALGRHAGPAGSAAGVPRPCRPDRGGRRGASLPPGHLAGALVPEFDLRRDAGFAQAGRASGTDGPSRRRAALGIADGDRVEIGNARGEVVLHARLFDGVEARRGHRRRHLAELGRMSAARASTC